MAYTPELSLKHSCALRRLAWALDIPMTKVMGKGLCIFARDLGQREGLPGMPGQIEMFRL
jgi:hypothetical protein